MGTLTASPRPATGGGRKQALKSRLRRDWPLLAFGLPGLLLLVLFQYIPLLGNVIAFKDYQPYIGILQSPWVGLSNFSVVFNGDPAFLNALVNTLEIFVIQTIFVFPAPICLALLLNSLLSERIKQAVQSVLYLPHFLSWVVVVAMFQSILGGAGLLNNWMRSQGEHPLNIIGNPELFKWLITSQVIWKDTGWAMILFLAALSAINISLYEAAAVDGASRLRQIWHITLPGIKGVVILLLILRLGSVLSVGFEQIVLQQGPVGINASQVLDTYVYTNGVLDGAWGVATAVGLVKGVLGVVLVLGANKVAHLFGERGVYEG
ncbi:putative aldouronate transport system permease protein [Actinopolymorpha cephalotaxi]|uniref:Aldouronate transport system permease protein n=1 Tax=Actinopolymorpha cephalotaxi TaxID=504797 RepID=A0A1I2ZWS3_9ACTN|nr:ABC transporter permease subunit [Actinopolymorpha cephalotaxi]NYH84218.1 putative aldouronate transport system permease protein [Actinopolymorpha cephalotaxi]SFH42362.1 putative aldouronate transport system permease protein [Actinopolymorpha cephalotaxi]